MSDVVKLAIISLIGTLITTVGVALVAYFTYGLKRTARDTNERVTQSAAVSLDTNDRVTETGHRVNAVHEQTNGRLIDTETALAKVIIERDHLRAQLQGRREGDA